MTQREFARTFHIPYQTLVTWEQGRREPHQTSLIYLHLIRTDPDAIQAMLKKALPERRRLAQEAA